MIKLNGYRTKVEILLDEPGVYVFQNSSGSGKSYLCSLLQSMSTRERVDSLTFSEVKKVDKVKLFDRGSSDLLLLDRYDMYFGQFVEEIEHFAKTGIVLIDCKSHTMPFAYSFCLISLYEGRLVVR